MARAELESRGCGSAVFERADRLADGEVSFNARGLRSTLADDAGEATRWRAVASRGERDTEFERRSLVPARPSADISGVVTLSSPPNPTTAAADASDAELLRAFARSRDELAFGRLVARHAAAVRRVALRQTGNPHAAEDVAQATYLVLSGRLGPAARSAARRGSVRPWLTKTCRYCAANWRRGERRRRRRERVAAVPERADPSRPGELAEAVAAAMTKLGRRDRRLIELHHLDDLPWPAVAAELKLSPDAARRAGARAVERLRGVLERRGITASAGVLLASMTVLSRAGRAAPAPTPFAFTLAKEVLLMLKLQTITVVLVAAGVVTLLGIGAAGGFSDGPGDAAGSTATRGPSTAPTAPAALTAPDASATPDAPAAEDARAAETVGGLTAGQFVLVHGQPTSARLDKPLDFREVPLADVIRFFREAAGADIDVHAQAIEFAGLLMDTPVTFQAKPGVAFADALRRVLSVAGGGVADLRLAWRHGVWVVTTAADLKAIDGRVAEQLGELLLEADGRGGAAGPKLPTRALGTPLKFDNVPFEDVLTFLDAVVKTRFVRNDARH